MYILVGVATKNRWLRPLGRIAISIGSSPVRGNDHEVVRSIPLIMVNFLLVTDSVVVVSPFVVVVVITSFVVTPNPKTNGVSTIANLVMIGPVVVDPLGASEGIVALSTEVYPLCVF